MKSTQRAWRRHHAQRKFANAKRVFIGWKMENTPEFLQWLRRNSDHLASFIWHRVRVICAGISANGKA